MVTSDAETAPEQPRQQVPQGAIEPYLNCTFRRIESTSRRRGDLHGCKAGYRVLQSHPRVCGACFYFQKAEPTIAELADHAT